MSDDMSDQEADGIVRVRVVNNSTDTRNENRAAEKSTFTSFPFTGGEPAQQILPRNEFRRRAQIIVASGLTNNNTAGYVFIGAANKVRNNAGATVPCGASFEYTGASPVYAKPDGTDSLTVIVLDEWGME